MSPPWPYNPCRFDCIMMDANMDDLISDSLDVPSSMDICSEVLSQHLSQDAVISYHK